MVCKIAGGSGWEADFAYTAEGLEALSQNVNGRGVPEDFRDVYRQSKQGNSRIKAKAKPGLGRMLQIRAHFDLGAFTHNSIPLICFKALFNQR